MSDKMYPWKRYWYVRGGDIHYSGKGCLDDPDSEWGRATNPSLQPFQSIAGTPCLILLGEPGMGKTSTMERERQAIDAHIQQQGDETLWRDLRSFGSEDRLVRSLFGGKEFVSWIAGKHRLHVFLDNFDTCLLRIDTVGSLLIEGLQHRPTDRLCLRLACRSADWHGHWEEELMRLWGQDAVGVYELAPLSRREIAIAAQANELDPKRFLKEVDDREAAPLAMRPVTLNFLLSVYRRTGGFPKTRVDLYHDGCRVLCEEPNADRRAARLVGRLSADQRLSLAARIAAVTILSNRNAIWTDIDQGDVPPEDVTVRELVGGDEEGADPARGVSESNIREVLGTGLFSSRGPNRLGWAHQTYAEFLAAWYLTHCGLPPGRTMHLLVHPGDAEGKLVPQLYETAAWVASMEPEVFRAIARSESEVLLRSDVATAEPKDKEALVDALLSTSGEQQWLNRSSGLRRYYRKLSHPGLAHQIRPYLTGTGRSLFTRATAIDIASQCQAPELLHDLADIALDPRQPLAPREQAAHAVSRSDNDDEKSRLEPLIASDAVDDPNGELKGWALFALWPDHMKADELFQVLIPPSREELNGAAFAD